MEADRARVVDRLTKEGRPGRSLPHTARHKRTRTQQILKPVFSFMTHTRLRVDRATTPGRGIYHDGRSLARGFWEGNILWRSWYQDQPRGLSFDHEDVAGQWRSSIDLSFLLNNGLLRGSCGRMRRTYRKARLMANF